MKKIVLRSDQPQKDWVEDFDHENGNYTCHCIQCDHYFYGHKRRVVCKQCAHPIKETDPVLDFSDLFHYVRSVQKLSGLSDTEASTLYHIMEMWQKKRYFEPIKYKLM